MSWRMLSPRMPGGTQRSTEAPMDFQFTSRPSAQVKPVWAHTNDEDGPPRKRPHSEIDPLAPAMPQPQPAPPVFGSKEPQNFPFLLQVSPSGTPQPQSWRPDGFSATNIFPPVKQEGTKDVDMTELSPPRPGANLGKDEAKGGRRFALGGLRRTYRARERERNRKLRVATHSPDEDDVASTASGSDNDDERRVSRVPRTQNLSNHYTLNMAAPPPPPSDLPYILLGYLQFFFNLSLTALFLYLLVQFILTVQRDVEQRISEYSMDIVQEISSCATHYNQNLCNINPVPAMRSQCLAWETCMNRDPTKVGRARVSAELIAEVVNSFVEPISWKTLAFTLTSLSFLTLFINSLLSLYRSRLHSQSHPQPPAQLHHQPSFPPPLAPSQHTSGWEQGIAIKDSGRRRKAT